MRKGACGSANKDSLRLHAGFLFSLSAGVAKMGVQPFVKRQLPPDEVVASDPPGSDNTCSTEAQSIRATIRGRLRPQECVSISSNPSKIELEQTLLRLCRGFPATGSTDSDQLGLAQNIHGGAFECSAKSP